MVNDTKTIGTCDCCGNEYEKYISGWDEYTKFAYETRCPKCGYHSKLVKQINKIIQKNVEMVFTGDNHYVKSGAAPNDIINLIKQILVRNVK